MESRKIVLMNLFTERHRDWSGGHSEGRKGWASRESSTEMYTLYTLPYIKQIANGKLLYNTTCTL